MLIEYFQEEFIPKRVNIFHGLPGAGRTTFLKYLETLYDLPEKDETWLEAFSVEYYIRWGRAKDLNIEQGSASYEAYERFREALEKGFNHPQKWVIIDGLFDGLHPIVQRDLAQQILELPSTLTFFIASNSPIFISEFPSRYIFEIALFEGERVIRQTFCGTLGEKTHIIEKNLFESQSTWGKRLDEFMTFYKGFSEHHSGQKRIEEEGQDLLRTYRLYGETYDTSISITIDSSILK